MVAHEQAVLGPCLGQLTLVYREDKGGGGPRPPPWALPVLSHACSPRGQVRGIVSRGWGDPRGGGGALTPWFWVPTVQRSCGCRLEKRGLSQTKELSEGRLSEGEYPVGALVVSLASPRKASWIGYNWCFGYSYKSNYSRTPENDVHWGQATVTTVFFCVFLNTLYFLLHGVQCHVLPVDLQHSIQWLYKYHRVYVCDI